MVATFHSRLQLFSQQPPNYAQHQGSDRDDQILQNTQPRRKTHRNLADALRTIICRPMTQSQPPTMDDQSPTPDPAAQEACIQAVVSVFPDVCLEYLDKLAGPLLYDPDTVITYLVDLIESGTTYTRRRQANLRKRKRDEDDDDDDLEEEEVCDAKRRYGHPSRAETSLSHGQMVAM